MSKATQGRARQLADNARFHILVSSIILSLAVASVVRLNTASDQLFFIRLEQVFGLISIIYLYIALITSPLAKMFNGRGWARQLVFARRAVGVSSAYFALLHMAVALWGQMGGLGGALLLPARFQVALLFGTVTLIVLLVLAATSFDAVIRFMTFPRWKLLHRLVYAGGVLLILHVWLIGTHVDDAGVQLTGFGMLTILIALEAQRVAQNLAKRYGWLAVSAGRRVAVAVGLWLVWSLLLATLPYTVQSFHDAQHAGNSEHDLSEQHGAGHE